MTEWKPDEERIRNGLAVVRDAQEEVVEEECEADCHGVTSFRKGKAPKLCGPCERRQGKLKQATRALPLDADGDVAP